MKKLFWIISVAIFAFSACKINEKTEDPLTPEMLADLWVTEYTESGRDGDITWTRVVEDYQFNADGTGYYECYLLDGNEYVKATSVRDNGALHFTITDYFVTVKGDKGNWTQTLAYVDGILTTEQGKVFQIATTEQQTLVDQLYGDWQAANSGEEIEGVDLSKVTRGMTLLDGDVVFGTLAANVRVTIEADATVTLAGATINGIHNDKYNWAGLTCQGNATIILKDGTTNTVTGFYEDYPGIFVPTESTLTIQGESEGTGLLVATSNGYGAGIGGGFDLSCGNIVIEGGTIEATGRGTASGIGGGEDAACGDIHIVGGTVTAKGGKAAAGIGTGGDESSSCGSITVEKTINGLRASKGQKARNSIGASDGGTCGPVTIGGLLFKDGVSTESYHYRGGAGIIVPSMFTVNGNGKQVIFSQGNLQYQASTNTWRFAVNQWECIGNDNVNISSTYDGWIDLFGWGTSGIDYDGHAVCYQPWSTTQDVTYYYPYNNSYTACLYDGGSNAGKADWGYNAISNGGNQTGMWRTLKWDEWTYVCNDRTTGNCVKDSNNARYTFTTIYLGEMGNSTGIFGVLLFPDHYAGPDDDISGVLSWGNFNTPGYCDTNCTIEGWRALENAGCVFFPFSGQRFVTRVEGVRLDGRYWSSTALNDRTCRVMVFMGNAVRWESYPRWHGLAVRLVYDVE